MENCLIAGMRISLERVTGRLTTGRVALGACLPELGLFVALASLFGRSVALALILSTMLFGTSCSARLRDSLAMR